MWMYLLSLRACASAALKDVSAYFSKEQGQVAVSKRTTETVPLITIKPTESLFSLLYVCVCECDSSSLPQSSLT